MRITWPTEDRERIVQALEHNDRLSFEERIERILKLRQEFGPPTDMLLMGGFQAMWALQELQNCYVTGNSMAVVFLALAFIEHSLGGSVVLSGPDELVEGGFAKLTRHAKETGAITAELFERFDHLRKTRNSYVHPAVGFKPGSIMARMVGSGLKHERDLPGSDAWYAIETVVDFMREQSPSWRPDGTGAGA